MARTTFCSQVLFLCHSRAKRRIPVPILSPRVRFPFPCEKRLLSTIRFPFPFGKGLGVRLFASIEQLNGALA